MTTAQLPDGTTKTKTGKPYTHAVAAYLDADYDVALQDGTVWHGPRKGWHVVQWTNKPDAMKAAALATKHGYTQGRIVEAVQA